MSGVSDDPACPVADCGATPEVGGPEMRCRGYGDGRDPRCLANWLSTDPENAGTYAEHLAHERGKTTW